MKELFKNKAFITFAIALCVLVIASITLTILKKNSIIAEKNEEKIENVETDEVNNLYKVLSSVNCEENLVWDFNNAGIISAKDINNDLKIQIILSKLDNESLLNESTNISLFNEYSLKMFNELVTLESNSIDFNGKSYLIDQEKTTITDSTECASSKYISILFGYSYNEDELSVDVAIAEIKNDELYNIDGEYIGKNDDKYQEVLRNSTIYRYGFKLNNNNYYLDNVTYVKTAKGPAE